MVKFSFMGGHGAPSPPRTLCLRVRTHPRKMPSLCDGEDPALCGPTGLKDGILKGLKAQNQMPRRVRFEQFEFA